MAKLNHFTGKDYSPRISQGQPKKQGNGHLVSLAGKDRDRVLNKHEQRRRDRYFEEQINIKDEQLRLRELIFDEKTSVTEKKEYENQLKKLNSMVLSVNAKGRNHYYRRHRNTHEFETGYSQYEHLSRGRKQ